MKKVLSVLVAFMMLFSICSVGVSAAVNDAVMALRVTPTATSYKPGDVVTFELSYETTEDIGKVNYGIFYIGYDSNVFEPIETISTDGVRLNLSQTVVLDGYKLAGQIAMEQAAVKLEGPLNSVDSAKGWDTSLKLDLMPAAGYTFFDASSETKVLAFKLKVKDAPTGDYAVGFTQAGIELGQMGTRVWEEYGGGDYIYGATGSGLGFTTSKIFDCTDATVVVEGGSPAPSYTVNTLDAQVQWADKEAGLMNLGFRGQFVGFDVEADKGTTVGPNGGTNLKEDTQLKEVGIILTKGEGSGTKYPVHTIYNFKDGGYFYRLVVGNVSYKDTVEFSAKAYVVIGSKTYNASNTITTTGKAQYDRAVKIEGFGSK